MSSVRSSARTLSRDRHHGITAALHQTQYWFVDATTILASSPKRSTSPEPAARTGAHRSDQGRPDGAWLGGSSQRSWILAGFKPNFDGHAGQIKLAAQEIARAHRPAHRPDHGVLIANATEELLQLAEKAQIPVAHSFLGVSAMDERTRERGYHGYARLEACQQDDPVADLLIALGMRSTIESRGTFRPSPLTRDHPRGHRPRGNRQVAVEIPIVGDVKRVLEALIPQVSGSNPRPAPAYSRRSRVGGKRRSSCHGTAPAPARRQLSRRLRVCQNRRGHQPRRHTGRRRGPEPMWTASCGSAARTATSAPAAGHDGYGLPAAMGAAVGRPDKETWAIVGDGGLQMTVQNS